MTKQIIEKNTYEYEFDLNGYPALWGFCTKWILNIKTVNGLTWSEFTDRAKKDMTETILWHEFKSRKDLIKNLAVLYDAQYVEDDAYDEFFQNQPP